MEITEKPLPPIFQILSVVSTSIQSMNPGEKFLINPGDIIHKDEILFFPLISQITP